MNLLLFRPHEIISPKRALIEGPRAFHLASTVDVQVGDSLRVGFPDGPQGLATVTARNEGEIHLEHDLDPEAPSSDPEPLFDIFLAMPRPRVFERLLRDLATLGLGRIVVSRSWRVEKSYLKAEILAPENYRNCLLEGLEQGRATRVPELVLAALFRPFVEDQLDALAPGRRLIANPGSPTQVADLSLARNERFMLAIGPEGGFIPFEVELLSQFGFEPFSLGSRIQRVESALLYTLGALDSRRR